MYEKNISLELLKKWEKRAFLKNHKSLLYEILVSCEAKNFDDAIRAVKLAKDFILKKYHYNECMYAVHLRDDKELKNCHIHLLVPYHVVENKRIQRKPLTKYDFMFLHREIDRIIKPFSVEKSLGMTSKSLYWARWKRFCDKTFAKFVREEIPQKERVYDTRQKEPV